MKLGMEPQTEASRVWSVLLRSEYLRTATGIPLISGSAGTNGLKAWRVTSIGMS